MVGHQVPQTAATLGWSIRVTHDTGPNFRCCDTLGGQRGGRVAEEARTSQNQGGGMWVWGLKVMMGHPLSAVQIRVYWYGTIEKIYLTTLGHIPS